MLSPLNNLLCILSLLMPLTLFAATPTWEVVPAASKITFTGTQNNSPISGEFKKFSGQIDGDIDQLQNSRITVAVEIGSISIAFKELEETLKAPDWFNVDLFPTATFESKQFIKTGDNTYRAKGNLTIRSKTLPVNVNLIVEEYAKDKAHIKGSMLLSRTSYGIGIGQWGSTREIKDEVTVNFILAANKKG